MNQQGRFTDEYPAGASVARRVTAPSRKISDSDLIFPGRSFQTKDRKIYSRRRFFEKIQRLTARVRYAQAHPELTNGKWSNSRLKARIAGGNDGGGGRSRTYDAADMSRVL